MAILNKVIDGLVGVPSMRRTRDFRMEAIKNMYDPTVYNEIATRQRTKASEGLSNLVEQQALRRTVDQMNRPIDPSLVGGNAARGMAMANMQQVQGNRAFSQTAGQLAEMDEEIRNQYGDAYTQTVAEQSQMMGQRRAGLANEQASFNEERSMRRMSLGINVAQTALGSIALPFAGKALGGAIGGAIAKSKGMAAAKTAIANKPMQPAQSPNDLPMEPPGIDSEMPATDYGSMRMTMPTPSQTQGPFQGPVQTQGPLPFQVSLPKFDSTFRSQPIDMSQPNWWARPIPGITPGGPGMKPGQNRFMQTPGLLPLNFY